MIVIFQYRTKKKEELITFPISNEDYFDEIEDGEVYGIESSPKTYDAWLYLGKKPDELVNLRVLLTDQEDSLEYAYTFWDYGNSYLVKIKRVNSKTNTLFEEIIITKTSVTETYLERNDVLRLRKFNNYFLVPVVDSTSINIYQHSHLGIGNFEEIILNRDTSGFKDGFDNFEHPLN